MKSGANFGAKLGTKFVAKLGAKFGFLSEKKGNEMNHCTCKDDRPTDEREGCDRCDHNRQLGKRGEDAACFYLARRGVRVIDRNWTCKSGEADIVGIDGDTLVFVEVKVRSSEARGFPEEAVNRFRRRRYEEIALAYLRRHDISSVFVRFDVISITQIDERRAFLRYHKDAFGGAF